MLHPLTGGRASDLGPLAQSPRFIRPVDLTLFSQEITFLPRATLHLPSRTLSLLLLNSRQSALTQSLPALLS